MEESRWTLAGGPFRCTSNVPSLGSREARRLAMRLGRHSASHAALWTACHDVGVCPAWAAGPRADSRRWWPKGGARPARDVGLTAGRSRRTVPQKHPGLKLLVVNVCTMEESPT